MTDYREQHRMKRAKRGSEGLSYHNCYFILKKRDFSPKNTDLQICFQSQRPIGVVDDLKMSKVDFELEMIFSTLIDKSAVFKFFEESKQKVAIILTNPQNPSIPASKTAAAISILAILFLEIRFPQKLVSRFLTIEYKISTQFPIFFSIIFQQITAVLGDMFEGEHFRLMYKKIYMLVYNVLFNMRKRSAQISADQIALLNLRKIQRAWRKHQFRKAINAHLKKKNKKKMIAMELKISQKKYCETLTMLVNDIVIPSKQAIGDQQLHSLMFSQLEGIQKLHVHFFAKLDTVMSEYSHRQTKISKVIIEDLFNIPEFKIKYSNYCANYAKANKIAKLLFSNNSGLNQILKNLGITNENQLDSLLISPMQRLCKYELILNNYHKSMNTDHCDYEDLEKAIIFVEKLVKETNQSVEQFLLADKFRMYKQFHSEILAFLPSQTRKLLFVIEDISEINLVTDVATNYKQLALFNDSLLLLPNNINTKPIFRKLWYVKDIPNFKYFKNIVRIISSEKYLTVQFKKEKHKENFLKKIEATDINTKQNKFIKVIVLGTETRQAVFKTYTVYIVEMIDDEFSKKIYPRFKDLLKVQQIVQNKKSCAELPSLAKQSLFSTLKSKTIERRKLVVQQFLQKIINTPQFFNIPEVKKILKLNTKAKTKKQVTNEKKITITLPCSQIVHIFIEVQGSSVGDLKMAIAEKLGLISTEQFQIFQVRNKNRRLMYNDELVSEIYREQQCYQSSFNPFKDTLCYLYTRHHYLEPDQQFQLYKNDFVRTQLQLSVIKSEIRNFQLQQQLMITFMCLFAMYINLPVHDEKKLSNYLKEIGKKQYKVSIEDFKSYYAEVQKKVEEEDDETVTIPFLIIKIMSNSFLYHCQQFEVTIHAKSYKEMKPYINGLEDKIILGIKRTHILLLTIESKHIVQSFPMEEVYIAEMYPTAIILKFQNLTPALRLNTNSGFQISRIFEIYKGKK